MLCPMFVSDTCSCPTHAHVLSRVHVRVVSWLNTCLCPVSLSVLLRCHHLNIHDLMTKCHNSTSIFVSFLKPLFIVFFTFNSALVFYVKSTKYISQQVAQGLLQHLKKLLIRNINMKFEYLIKMWRFTRIKVVSIINSIANRLKCICKTCSDASRNIHY